VRKNPAAGHAANGPAIRLNTGMQKVIPWLLVVFVIYYLVTDPGGAAHVVQSILHGLGNIGNSLGSFVNSL
jgi:hypothetical protein